VISATAVESAVSAVCRDLQMRARVQKAWVELEEANLFREIVACILGSRVSFEMAVSATERLEQMGLLDFSGTVDRYKLSVEGALSKPLSHPRWRRPRRYRFPAARSTAISLTANSFYGDGEGIKPWLSRFPNGCSARRDLLAFATGVGPKQASMFLRNINYCDTLAILDSHMMRFMDLLDIGCGVRRVASIAEYERAESRLMEYAEARSVPMATLDQAVWVVMRVCSRRAS
jgi:N-glycosylase/DNA lyase